MASALRASSGWGAASHLLPPPSRWVDHLLSPGVRGQCWGGLEILWGFLLHFLMTWHSFWSHLILSNILECGFWALDCERPCVLLSLIASQLLEATMEMGTEPSIRVMTGLGSSPDSSTCIGKGNMRYSKSVCYYNVHIASIPTTDYPSSNSFCLWCLLRIHSSVLHLCLSSDHWPLAALPQLWQ